MREDEVHIYLLQKHLIIFCLLHDMHMCDGQIILGPISNKIYENHALKENFDTPIIS